MYDSPHQFEPLIPSAIPTDLIEKSAEIAQAATRLSGAAHPSSRGTIRELVRSMNSYYSNRIEGQGTHPLNIERALRKEFSDKPDVARLQRVAIAHIEAERELEERAAAGVPAMSSAFLIEAHHALYSRLSEADRTTEDNRIVSPGAIRENEVEVGEHVPPTYSSLPLFMERLDTVFNRKRSWDSQLIAIACLHHRAAWVHPFLDGNGRAVRLQTHCALWPLSDGLWSPSRGLAREQKEYYSQLMIADASRRGDLDGRGNLTTAGLLSWIRFFLDICADQAEYMGKMLDLDGMKRRIGALVTFRAAFDKTVRTEAILPLYHVFAAGPVTRGEFSQMTGLGERTARSLIASLLRTGLLESHTHGGPLKWGLPLDSLQFLFPELYPEAATKAE
ncbi:Fic family protein [Massilia aerilata]|uniref:Fic family protein n=1 Tax=Massilia aerilata TaxID=453817 RepID=A0ABW0RYE6_9BURK